MEIVQIALDEKLLHAADQAAKRTKRTVLLWCATPCGNISAGWNCEPVKSAIARVTRDMRKPTRKRGAGNRRRVAGRLAR